MKTRRTRGADVHSQSHSQESDLTTIIDVVMWNQMPFLSVRRLTQLNCPRWSMWDPYNFIRIVETRTSDDTRDWYFPIIVKAAYTVGDKKIKAPDRSEAELLSTLIERLPEDEGLAPDASTWWSWCGVWHSNANEASDRALSLPPLTHVPFEWRYKGNARSDILASSGGLLLIKGMTGIVPSRRSKRLNPVLADPNPKSISVKSASGSSHGWRTVRTLQSWRRLLVFNPLTKECRELPAADCRLLDMQSWEIAYEAGVQADIMVDEETNSYQVVLTTTNFVAVYKSTTGIWNLKKFPQESPWGRIVPSRHFRIFNTWEYKGARAKVGRHLYFGDVVSTIDNIAARIDVGMEPTETPRAAATLRLFEVLTEAGRWEEVQQFTLRKFHIPNLQYSVRNAKGFSYGMGVLPYLEIVECRGDLYGILPAKIHDVWVIGEKQSQSWKSEVFDIQKNEGGSEFGYMPVSFYVMQLQGLGEDVAVLRIRVPRSRSDYQARISRLMLGHPERHFYERWISGEGRGSVIWVACEDYLLSFDIVTRASTTQILTPDDGVERPYEEKNLGFSYRPSLHMKP